MDTEYVFLLNAASHAELARETPHRDGNKFVTGERIAQNVRDASALTPSGIVRVAERDGIWCLDPNGIEAYIS